MAKHLSSGLGRLALALVLSIVAGVALAGLAFPVLGGIGLAAKSGADDFLRLPADLDPPPLAQTTTILASDGTTVIAKLFNQQRVEIKLGQVPRLTQLALVDIEDNRFYEHNGIDYKGTARALVTNSNAGSVQQGGSTLTQQYVKNVLLDSARSKAAQTAATERNLSRKLQEARYALQLEKKFSKDQILEGYLNIAYYGDGVYGIGTAAQHYFSKSVSQLDLAQGALFAGMVQNPQGYDPVTHKAAAIKRRNTVLARMYELGTITKAQEVQAIHEPVTLHLLTTKSGCEAARVAPFFCDYVRRYLEDDPTQTALGDTRSERQQRLLNGGLTIRTTLDITAQNAADAAVNAKLPSTDPFGAVAVADTVEPGTGAVKSMAVDRGFGTGHGNTKVNFALGGSAGYQGGSTFKAFVMAAALTQGLPTTTTFYAPNVYCPKAFTYKTGSGKCPSNAGDSESGTFDMASAAWDSVNTYFIQLEEKTGLDQPPSIAGALGVKNVVDGSPLAHVPSFVLGSAGEVSPLAMAGAYASFAAHGKFCAPTPIESIRDSSGKAVHVANPECEQALRPDVADTLTGILRGVVEGGHAKTGGAAYFGRPLAGKTGTTNLDQGAAWFIGYTPQLATAVWMGLPTPAPLRGTIDGRYYPQVFGGDIPADIFHDDMQAALAGSPVEDLAPAVGSHVGRSSSSTYKRYVPNVVGKPYDQAAATLQARGFVAVAGATVNNATIPAGGVVSESPSGSAAPGSTIVLTLSSGQPPQPGSGPTDAPQPAATRTPPASPQPAPRPKPSHSPRR